MRLRATASAWFELLRLPNLFTVPGDVVAGAFLAGACMTPRSLAPLAGASLLLYCGGLVLNDWFDRAVDAVERPKRPIPSGRVRPAAALVAGTLMLIAGTVLGAAVGARSGVIVAALAVLIVLYNGPARRLAPVGFLAMGLLRGGNVLLGASAAPGWLSAPALVAAAVSAGYILAVTAAAHREAVGGVGRLKAYMPTAVAAAGLTALLTVSWPAPAGAAASAVALGLIGATSARLAAERSPGGTQAAIGSFIRALLPIQAAFVLSAGDSPGHLLFAGVLYLAVPLARLAGRGFKGS